MELQNIVQLLKATAEMYPENELIFYLPGNGGNEGVHLNYAELSQRAEFNSKRANQLGLKPGSIVLLHFNTHLDNLEWFWAVVIAGYVPAFSTPFVNNVEQKLKHIHHLHTILDDPLCLTTEDLVSEFEGQNVLRTYAIEKFASVVVEEEAFPYPSGWGSYKSGNDLALLMLTSGSTGNAKAVSLTHQQLLRSIAGKAHFNETTSVGPFLNWCGLDHVAGLTEIHLHATFVGADQIYVPVGNLIRDPLRFLDLINKHRVSYTFATNSFLASLRKALESPAATALRDKLELSCLKTIVTGGEANVVETCVALTKLLEEHGTACNVLSPAFGMTETCAGAVYSKDFPRRDIECRNEFATLGSCVLGIEMRITNNGKVIGPNLTGNLELSGPIVFQKYHNNPEATAEAFDGIWFKTGDLGYIDDLGQLNLTGRAKETIIINGLNYFPFEIESSLNNIPGVQPSYTVAFAYRPERSQTESICLVYNPNYNADDIEMRVETDDAIIRAVVLHTGVNPYTLPLDSKILQKTTLGKLSRTKIRKAFENGEYEMYQNLNEKAIASYRAANYKGPANRLEELILTIFEESFNIPKYDFSVNTNLFTMGVNSVDLIKIKQRLQHELKIDQIPIITVMTNPSAQALSLALKSLVKSPEYNPMVVLQSQGSKSPLWLIHPGIGEILIFLALASYFDDRPIYAMRARGFEEGQSYFANIEEAVTTYHKKIKSVQPRGPYAIAGYSYGSMIAFEITKLLNNDGDEVKFLGVFNLPPHIKFRMRQLDWTNCLLHLSFFVNLFTEEYAQEMYPTMCLLSRKEVLAHIISIAPKDRMEEMGLDMEKLSKWADLAYSLQSAAVDYEPSGMVENVDVFYAIPLADVARDVEDWKANHLAKWADFSRTKPKMHEVDGAHYTMMNPTHVVSFQKKLKAVLADYGI